MSDEDQRDRPQPGFADYLRILERRRWIVIGAIVLVTALSAAFALNQTKSYRAATTVLLTRKDLPSSVLGAPQDPTLSEDPARFAADAASLARSSAVAQLAIDRAHISGRTAGQLLDESSVAASPTADLLNFSVEDSDPAVAATLVNAYASAFAEYSLRQDNAALATARAQLAARLASLAHSGQVNTAQYRTLAATEQRLHTMALLQTPDTVLNRPSSGTQVKPTPLKDTLLGLGLGVLLGVALAFALDAIDKRVRSENELERELGLPLLARLPRPPASTRKSVGLTMLRDRRSAHADGIRRLATRVAFASPDRRDAIVMVTSAVDREGKSTTVANLGVALALTGHRVAVVDLDLGRPSLASVFGIGAGDGVTEVVMGHADLSEALVAVHLPALDEPLAADDLRVQGALRVLTSGLLPSSPGELVASEALVTRVLAPLAKRFDYVLIDSPPMCVVGDAATLATRVDAVVVVARPGIVERGQVRDVRRQLSASPARVLGFVVTDVEPGPAYGYSAYVGRDERFREDDGTARANGNGSTRTSVGRAT